MAKFGSAAIAIRVYFSIHHMAGAQHFSHLAKDIEDAYSGRPKSDMRHMSYVLNSILSSVCFLEAAINELYQDATDRHGDYFTSLEAEKCEQLANKWIGPGGLHKSRKPTLEKYQQALGAIQQAPFVKGAPLFQDANLVIQLRNALTHPVPKTTPSTALIDFEGQLLRKNFPTNRLMKGSANAFFPDHCLGAGCVEWAVATVRAFADEFFRRMEVEPSYQRVDFGLYAIRATFSNSRPPAT